MAINIGTINDGTRHLSWLRITSVFLHWQGIMIQTYISIYLLLFYFERITIIYNLIRNYSTKVSVWFQYHTEESVTKKKRVKWHQFLPTYPLYVMYFLFSNRTIHISETTLVTCIYVLLLALLFASKWEIIYWYTYSTKNSCSSDFYWIQHNFVE